MQKRFCWDFPETRWKMGKQYFDYEFIKLSFRQGWIKGCASPFKLHLIPTWKRCQVLTETGNKVEQIRPAGSKASETITYATMPSTIAWIGFRVNTKIVFSINIDPSQLSFDWWKINTLSAIENSSWSLKQTSAENLRENKARLWC